VLLYTPPDYGWGNRLLDLAVSFYFYFLQTKKAGLLLS
jgi:hypothetical protein